MTLKILVTNDDGVNAPGLRVAKQIAEEIAGTNGKVITVAPSLDQSGVAHSISYLRPSLISKYNETTYVVEGSPSDCILAGIYYIMKGDSPDLILSGVNNGHNVAEDILYSGTVGAAMEGALQGIKSIALSQCYSKESLQYEDKFEAARALGATVCSKLVNFVESNLDPYQTFYNVNFPATRASDVQGIKVCPQGRRPKGSFQMDAFKSPHGRTFLMVNHQPKTSDLNQDTSNKSDYKRIEDDFITVTPLKADLNDLNALQTLKNQISSNVS